jgi:hypothetical protein
VSAGGGRFPLPQSAGVHGWSATGDHHAPALLRLAAAASSGQWPSGQHRPHSSRTADAAAVSGSTDTCRGFHARSAQPADSEGPGAWTVDAAGGRRQPVGAGAADTRDGGSVMQTLRQRHAGQPAAQPSTATPDVRPGRTGPQGAAAASTRHGLTARSVAWCSASIWSGSDGSRWIVWVIRWMIDCHRNDTRP